MYDDLQLEHSSTVDRAVEALRRALFAGQLTPGTPLREVALSEAMEVGRSTIREALSLLVADGLAVRFPHKGVAVKELSAADVRDVILARVTLETAGVRRWESASDDQRQRVRDSLREYAELAQPGVDPATLTEAHLRIHGALVGLTGSRRLLAAAEALSSEIRLGLAHLDRTRGNLAEQVAEHRGLVLLLESGDVSAAMQRLDDHLSAAQRSLLQATGHGQASV